MMSDREKVIRGLEACARDVQIMHCCECPYNGTLCITPLLRDALALLKEQEARVMTLEELQAIGMQWNRNTPPYLLVEERSATGSRWVSWGFMHDCVRLIMGVKNYGTKWRVWNLQPTPEQMRDTKWEKDDDSD